MWSNGIQLLRGKQMSNEQIQVMGASTKPIYSSLTGGYIHQLHLKTPIKEPEEYIEWVQLIRSATQDDRIELHLNTPGGDIYTAIELLHAFAYSDAHIHVVCSGLVASAGTVLMTVGDSFEINPHTTFMFHNYSGGTIGKGNEMAIKIDYEREWSRKFMHDVYEGLLSEHEIDDLLDGRDYWLSAEEIGDRLENMISVRNEKAEDMLKELTEILEETEEKPKTKRKARKKKAEDV